MTPMRDAAISGPALRDADSQVDWYLATELCTQILGVEMCHISDVQGHQKDGYRVSHEKENLIVPLMRGGEPMAFGVNRALPLAMFLHAKFPGDILINIFKITQHRSVNLRICATHSRSSCLSHYRGSCVILNKSVSTSRIAQELSRFRHLSFVALRLSNNQFTGKGPTNTGHRLFNSVLLD
ncbi:hypothetical protein N7523_005894 [Penicillium sp. IBT 18751x]|nr:hypothetical protein N7523_005894 [Penicillium sp. IBT 18751x]